MMVSLFIVLWFCFFPSTKQIKYLVKLLQTGAHRPPGTFLQQLYAIGDVHCCLQCCLDLSQTVTGYLSLLLIVIAIHCHCPVWYLTSLYSFETDTGLDFIVQMMISYCFPWHRLMWPSWHNFQWSHPTGQQWVGWESDSELEKHPHCGWMGFILTYMQSLCLASILVIYLSVEATCVWW